MSIEKIPARVIYPDGTTKKKNIELYYSNNYFELLIPHKKIDNTLIPFQEGFKYTFSPRVLLLKYNRNATHLAYITPSKVHLIILDSLRVNDPLHITLPPGVLRYLGGNSYSRYWPFNKWVAIRRKLKPVRLTPYALVQQGHLVIYRVSVKNLEDVLQYLYKCQCSFYIWKSDKLQYYDHTIHFNTLVQIIQVVQHNTLFYIVKLPSYTWFTALHPEHRTVTYKSIKPSVLLICHPEPYFD